MSINRIKEEYLALLQDGFPLVKEPFKDIAEKLKIDEDEALVFYKILKNERIIRQTSAIFDTKRLGYRSALVAFSIPSDNVEDVVKFVNLHPGVSHNYLRSHEYNLWFTLAVPPDSLMGIEATISSIAKRFSVGKYLILPNIKMFKIAVKLDKCKSATKREKVEKKEYVDISITQTHRKVIIALQEDINPVRYPFDDMMQKADLDTNAFFSTAQELLEAGYMRRYASILNHREAGFRSNAMVVWNIPDEKADLCGKKSAEFTAISHCYLRPRINDWQYNLFTMIHAQTPDELDTIVSTLSEELQSKNYYLLNTLQEYKKCRIKYLTNDFYEWERTALSDLE